MKKGSVLASVSAGVIAIGAGGARLVAAGSHDASGVAHEAPGLIHEAPGASHDRGFVDEHGREIFDVGKEGAKYCNEQAEQGDSCIPGQ
jgi:hypothetical protein